MKIHSGEQFNSGEPQQPLQVGSTPEARSKRNKKRRSKSKKTPLTEKGISGDFEAVETEVRQNEVRLIWNRDERNSELGTKNSRSKKVPAEKKQGSTERPTLVEAVETVIDHSVEPVKPAQSPPKPASPPEPRPHVQKSNLETTSEDMSSTPEAFQSLLDDLVNERIADAARSKELETTAKAATSAHASERSEPSQAREASKNVNVALSPPPSLPPEASSYRHFFWNEPTIMSPAEAMAERTMLPAVDRPEVQARNQSTERQYVEANATSSARSENIPQDPGYRPELEKLSMPEMPVQPEDFDFADQTSETANRPPALEAVPLHAAGDLQFPERMPNARSAPREAFESVIPGVAPEAPQPQQNLGQEQLGAAELRSLSKKIKVDGVALSEILAAKRIDDEGLRTVIQTFLRGGDVRKQLTQEIINHEKSFERDPMGRHQTGGQVRSALANTSAKLAQKSYALTKTSQKATREATRVLKGAAKQAHHELRDSSLAERWPSIAAIAVIYTLIIILLIS